VYFGDNFDDVNDRTADAFRGNPTDAMFIVGFFGFPYPDGLVPGTTYYWRIDEVNDANVDSPWQGDVWSFWIPPRKAHEPDPPDGARFINTDATLGWTAGLAAAFHFVYFGDNFDDVNSATAGQLVAATSYTPGTLELGKTYYWRVDESDGATTYKGDIWSFATMPDIPIADPNLTGWWKFDEGSGVIAIDGSGHGNHGTLTGGPQWVVGHDGDALEFTGSGTYVDCGNDEALNVDLFSVSFWCNIPSTQSWNHIISRGSHGASGSPGSVNWGVMMYDAQETILFETFNDTSWTGVTADTTTGEWHHVVATYDGDTMQLYHDGTLANTTSGAGILLDQNRPLLIGARSDAGSAGGFFSGSVDDVRIYNEVLPQGEIEEIMRGDTTLAWGPSPANGSTPDIDAAIPVSWSPGDIAAQHAVYFGTDRNAVDNADASDTTGIYRGQQVGTSYSPPEGVEWGGGPYYWRIDEHNTDATVSTGRIWTFTVADFLVVDDFESYDDVGNFVYLTWLDGFDNPATNGSTTGYPSGASMETGNVHGGLQSMPYRYDNSFKTSQATRTLTADLRDWTRGGVTTLSLWFYGDPANAPERMNVALNGAAPMYHADPSAATIGSWTQWPIPLSSFGVPLTNVTSITIGFGVPGSTAAGGTGDMLFDDIQLIR
jgi:hypothetical protein